MTPEKRVQNKITAFLDKEAASNPKLLVFRRQAGGFSYHSGLPDLWFLFDGIHCEVEVKAEGGFPSPLQLKWETKLKQAGAIYWRGNSFADFKNFYDSLF